MIAVFPLALLLLFFFALLVVAGVTGLMYRHRAAVRRNLGPILGVVGLFGAMLLILIMLLGYVRVQQSEPGMAELQLQNQSAVPTRTGPKVPFKNPYRPKGNGAHEAGTSTKAPVAKVAAAKDEDAPKVETTPRPKWMDKPIGRDGNLFRTILTIGPFVTPEECEAALPEHLRIGAHQYVQMYQSPHSPVNVTLPLSFVEQRVLRDKWLQPIVSPTVGPMVQMQVLLEFGTESQQMVDQLVRQRNLEGRMTFVGLLAFVVLGIVAIVFAYLRTDLATGGRHHGLLRAGATVGILCLLLVGLGMLAIA